MRPERLRGDRWPRNVRVPWRAVEVGGEGLRIPETTSDGSEEGEEKREVKS